MAQALTERTKTAASVQMPATVRPPVSRPWAPVAKKTPTPEAQENIAERIHTAFLKGDLDTLRKLGALEEGIVVTPPDSGTSLEDRNFEQEFFGIDTSEAGVKQLMDSYGSARFVPVDQIYELREGDVVDFSGLMLQNGMQVPHFRIVKINNRGSSETEHILQCIVNSYYPFGNGRYRIIREAIMEIKIPKPPKKIMGVRLGAAEPMLKEHQVIKAFHITLGKDRDGGEIIVERKLFLASAVGGMRVYSNNKDAFEK